MAIIRDFTNPFKITDWTQELNIVPNKYGKVTQMGLFEHEAVATPNVSFEVLDRELTLIGDRPRGERNNVGKDRTRYIKSFYIPHFPVDDAIHPEDIAGNVAFGGSGEGIVERLDLVRARKMEDIAEAHDTTLEVARVETIVTGDIYAPNGTTVGNFYTDFGVTPEVVDFNLSVSTTEVILKCNQVIAYIQDNAKTGQVINQVVSLCNPAFMDALLTQAGVKAAWLYQNNTNQDPLRTRLSSGLDREFVFGGIRFIEYRGFKPNGDPMIPDGEARFFPMGTRGIFKTYFAPASRFDTVNTFGMERYMFERVNESNTEILLQSESNFLNVVRKPQLIVRGNA